MYIIYWTENGRAHRHNYGQKERADYFVEHLKKTISCTDIAIVKV